MSTTKEAHNSFSTLRSLVSSLTYPSLPDLSKHQSFHCLQSHGAGIRQCVVFLDWSISFNNMHLAFCGLLAYFCLVLYNILLLECTIVYLSSHGMRDNLVVLGPHNYAYLCAKFCVDGVFNPAGWILRSAIVGLGTKSMFSFGSSCQTAAFTSAVSVSPLCTLPSTGDCHCFGFPGPHRYVVV